MQPILAPHVRTFVDCLTDLPVQPSSVWLIGSQASGRAQAGSDTDLLVFGPPGLIDAIRATLSQPHGIDCMVLVNGDDFEDPWQEKGGSLSRWRWALKSATEAQYEGNKFIADEPGGSLGQFETRQERAHPHLVQLKASGMRVFPPEVRQARRPTSLAPMATSWINRAPLGHQTGEKMLLVYVDTGGMLKEVAALEAAGLLKTHYFPFEQRNRRVKAFVPGSGASWKQSNLSWKEAPGTWNDYKPSALFEPLRKLLGAKVDAQHLDSGVKAGCSVFLTSDKTDIWSKRDAIQALANIRVLHMPSELATLRQLANQG